MLGCKDIGIRKSEVIFVKKIFFKVCDEHIYSSVRIRVKGTEKEIWKGV